jgi:hypothetical protein
MIKLVNIKAFHAGLVFENGNLIKVLQEGKHWISGSKIVEIYDMTLPFVPAQNLQLLLRNEELSKCLDIINVGEEQLVLRFVNNRLHTVLPTGQYAFWKLGLDNKFQTVDISNYKIQNEIPKHILENRLMDLYVRKIKLDYFQKAMLYIDQKFDSVLENGTFYWWNNTQNISFQIIDTRVQLLEINGQEILTKDKASLRINFGLRYQIKDINKLISDVKEYEKQLYSIFQLALREYISTLSFDELLIKKHEVSLDIEKQVASSVSDLGISIIDCGIKDVILPGEMKEIMNKVLIAEKKSQANSIMRREETAATRSMLNTAKLMEENQMLWKLKEMEYIEKITEKIEKVSLSGNGNILSQMKEMFSK